MNQRDDPDEDNEVLLLSATLLPASQPKVKWLDRSTQLADEKDFYFKDSRSGRWEHSTSKGLIQLMLLWHMTCSKVSGTCPLV